MRKSVLILLLLLVVTLAGCVSRFGSLDSWAPKEDVAVAENYVDDLRHVRLGEIEAVADPSIQSPDLHSQLLSMAAAFPSGEPKSIKIVGVRTGKSPSFTSINLTFEYEFANSWVLTNVAVQKKDGKSTIFGISAYPMQDSLEHINSFTLHGKSMLAYLFLILAVAVPLFIVAVLVLCIRTRGLKRKWAWVIFIIFGICTFSIDWTTGQTFFKPVSFQLLGAGAFAPPFGAWLISIAIPIGAIAFLIKRLRLTPPSATGTPVADTLES